MKKLSLVLLLLCAAMYSATAGGHKPVADSRLSSSDDPRIELVTIVHVLSKEKCSTHLEEKYKQAIRAQFGKYKKHTAVQYWKAIRDKYELAPNEVGVNLTFENGLYEIQEQVANAFFTELSEQERAEFVRLLNDFSHKSYFKAYYSRIALAK